MRVALVCLLACIAAVLADPVDKLSFGQLAQLQAAGKWDAMLKELQNVDAKAKPKDKILGVVRDGLADLRDVADMFVFTYPILSLDVWPIMRKDFTDGYKFLSHYTDLLAVNYSVAAEESELAAILDWKTQFLNRSTALNYSFFVSNPDLSQLFYRSETEYNQLWWGNQTEYLPQQNGTGISNIGLLLLAQVLHLQQRLPVLMALPNVSNLDDATFMHDYKKQVRAMLLVAGLYPASLATSSSYYSKAVAAIQTGYEEISKAKKPLTSVFYYLEYGPPDALAYACIAADESLYQLKIWLDQTDWADYLRLYEAIILR